MDINALRVFNSLYKLKLTEQDFKEVEAETNCVEHTGLYIHKKVKANAYLCISHDEKHKIVLRAVKSKSGTELPSKSRILFKTLIPIFDLPNEVYQLHQIAEYRTADSDIKFRISTLDELKDKICDRFEDKNYELGGLYDDMYGNYEDKEKNKQRRLTAMETQLKALFWLFGEDFSQFKMNYVRPNIARIIKVFERNNRRLAIIQENEDYDKARGTGFMFSPRYTEHIIRLSVHIRSFKPKDERYDYVDVNRELLLPDKYHEHTEVWLSDELFEKVSEKELEVISSREQTNWFLLNANKYNNMKSAIRLEMLSAKKKSQMEQAKKQLVEQIRKQFDNGEVVRNGISFTKNSVSYDGLTLKGSKLGEYVVGQQIFYATEPNFNDIFYGYIDYTMNIDIQHNPYNYNKTSQSVGFEGKQTIELGNIKAVIQKIKHNIFVNDKRICKDDVRVVLKYMLNFKEQAEYDKFIDECNKVSLTIQKALKDGGFTFELEYDKTDDNCLIPVDEIGRQRNEDRNLLLSIPIVREKNKYYALIKGKRFKVKNINALLDLGKDISGYLRDGHLQRTIKLLYRALAEITPKEIGELIQDGKVEYEKLVKRKKEEQKECIARSKEFLANAIKITNAKENKDGWIVKGISERNYFVDKEGKVWEVKDDKTQGRYICIVDDYNDDEADGEAGLNDMIAKRLLYLSKDKKLANEIHTLNLDSDTEVDDEEIEENMIEVEI